MHVVVGVTTAYDLSEALADVTKEAGLRLYFLQLKRTLLNQIRPSHFALNQLGVPTERVLVLRVSAWSHLCKVLRNSGWCKFLAELHNSNCVLLLCSQHCSTCHVVCHNGINVFRKIKLSRYFL